MNSKFWYKPFSWVPPVTEKVTDKKGREKVIVKKQGFYQMNYAPGSKITSGERVYEVQPSGALKCLNKAPSKRDLHREASR